ncbi:MAG: c-type cytochrome [Pseudomonadota bacterium]
MRVHSMRLPVARLFGFFLPFVLALLPAHAAVPEGQQDSGKEIYGPCAACHGDLGQGGKRGEYPRIAGQRAAYIEYSLKKFRSRERINIPMFPYTQERELPDADIKAVAAYIAGIKLSTEVPDFKPTDDALTRLEAMQNIMIIPKLDGDLANGGKLYKEECAYCHGADGRGKTRFPMLVGQYTNYLQKQMDAYLKGERPHDAVEDEEEEEAKPKTAVKKVGVLNRLTEKDIKDILAYITRLQDE